MEKKNENKNEKTEKQIAAINEQIKTQMHYAYNDIVRESLDNCDYEFIGTLYAEIRDRLCTFVTKNGITYNKLHEDFDVEFLKELMKNKQLTVDHLHGVVHMTFHWIKKMQAPFRDRESEAAEQRVLNGIDAEDIVPSYLNEAHECLDKIEKDIKELILNRNHPVVKNMLERGMKAAGIKK
tara:strand:+ start:15088 stop:15630 length:543 start_codon:yes stop_codon:yes gene_type:complete